MPGDTKISWANKTWNPVTGCSKVSEGCRHCYAERISLERGFTRYPWTAANASANVKMRPERLQQPDCWKKPCRIFVNSMSDFFHERVAFQFQTEILDTIEANPRHTFQILTKRPRNMSLSFGGDPGEEYPWPDNLWLGVSIETQKYLDRLAPLKRMDAAIRFVSFEPLLGAIGEVDLEGIHWIIVGGESGPEHRPMDMAWARELRDQADAAGVAFFYKQDNGPRAGLRPWIVEKDGTRTKIQQYPEIEGIILQPGLF